MKKLILNLAAAVMCIAATAQANNPFDSFGKEYFEAVNKIVADIKQNGFKGNDQKSLDYYKGLTSLDFTINPDLAKEAYRFQNAEKPDIKKLIDNATASDACKEFSLRIIKDLSKLPLEEKLKYYATLTEDVKNSDISEGEKMINLKMISVANYAYRNPEVIIVKGEGCIIINDGEISFVDPTKCVIVGALFGAYIGGSTCGWWCALGGAIVMGVITAISVC